MSEVKTDFYKVLYPPFRVRLDSQYYRMVRGVEHIPEGSALYAANHIEFADSPLIAASFYEATGVPLRFAAKREYFDGLGLDDKGKYGRSVKWLMEHSLMIPVDRENTNPRAFQQLQQAVADRMEWGDSVALHPEGTRSEDGKLHKFKSGAARIALALSVPIVPVGITYEYYDNRRRPHVEISFGEPVMPDEYTKLPYSILPGRQKAEHLTQVIEDRVSDLTGMPQSGAFAELRKFRRQHQK